MLLILLLIWLVTGTALIALAVQRQLGSAGLPLAYFLGLTMNHVPGVLLYLDGEELNSAAVVTRIGFEQTVIGMVAFLIGVAIARYFLVAPGNPTQRSGIAERLWLSNDCVGSIGVNLSGHRGRCIFCFHTLVK